MRFIPRGGRREALDPTQAAAVRRLRAHFARHNRLVVLLAVFTVLVAAGLWALAYTALSVLGLLSVTVVRGVEGRLPESFPALFIYAAGLLILLTWLAHRYVGHRPPADDKGVAEVAADFLLALPRATLAVWGNLSAWQRLSDGELVLAAAFLERLERARRIPMHEVAVDFPEPESRLRILLALQLVELLRLQHSDGVAWLHRVPAREILPSKV